MHPFHKKLFRAMLQAWGQSLAVISVVLCGVACYICFYSCHANLTLTRDTYYDTQRLADFEVLLERAPITATFKIAEIPGVRRAEGRIVKDVNVDLEGVPETRVGRLISLPDPRRQVLDDIVLKAGRYFEPGAQDEVILSDDFATSNGIALGDRIGVTVNEKKHSLRVVGRALSPEYVYMIRNVQELMPDPKRFGILWAPEDFVETALDMREACNSIVGMVDRIEDLDTILDRADKVLDPFGVFAKMKQVDKVSARFLADEIKGLGVTAKVVPTVFLGIAALILLVLLNRMVRMERTQIGLMKAYGYSDFAVALHYVEYALLLTVVGALGGFVLGQWLAGGMMSLYVQFYKFPLLESRIYPDVLLRSMGVAIGFAVFGALLAAFRAAQIHPAEAMRPESPREAHRIWLERLPRIWRNLGFTWRMILRNISRNKFRAGLNVFGVAVSTGLLIMGFFSMDAMDFAMRFQFQRVQREDVRVSFQTEHGKESLYESSRLRSVRRAEPLLQYPFEMKHGWRTKEIVVTGVPRNSELQKVMTFAGEEVPVPAEGMVLSDRLARTMALAPGDRVTLKPLMGRIEKEKEVTVTGTAQQFLGAGAYMDIEALSRLLDESFAMNTALLRIEEGGDRVLNEQLKEVAGVAAVSYTIDAYQSIVDTIKASMAIMTTIQLGFSAIIAFSIIYNVTLVSLSERQRELASLRVLGLTPAEVGQIMYHENVVLGVLGTLAGIPLGMAVCALLVKAYDTDLYRIPFHIERSTFGVSIVMALACVFVANLAVKGRIRRFDLVEVLKERD